METPLPVLVEADISLTGQVRQQGIPPISDRLPALDSVVYREVARVVEVWCLLAQLSDRSASDYLPTGQFAVPQGCRWGRIYGQRFLELLQSFGWFAHAKIQLPKIVGLPIEKFPRNVWVSDARATLEVAPGGRVVMNVERSQPWGSAHRPDFHIDVLKTPFHSF